MTTIIFKVLAYFNPSDFLEPDFMKIYGHDWTMLKKKE